MSNHKVLSSEDNGHFIKTQSFKELFNLLKTLKRGQGRFIHVMGTPGTGKSANIYQSLSQLDLNVYDAFLFIDIDSTSSEVLDIFWDTIQRDMGVTSHKEIYEKASTYDLVLFADRFLDSEYLDPDKVGLGLWTEKHGPSTFPFYFRILLEYIKNRNKLKNINVITQTSWVLKFRDVRYDILTDFGLFSRFLVFLIKQLFEVVIISYSHDEVIKIVRNHPLAGNDEEIEDYIKKYGNRPRFIFEALEKDSE